MKKYIILFLFFVIVFPITVNAGIGDMGFFGGITEGRPLPRTIEQLLVQQGVQNRNGQGGSVDTFEYNELIFLNGRPVLFEGSMNIVSGRPDVNSQVGTFFVQYRVNPSIATTDVELSRFMNFEVSYRRVNDQIVYHYNVIRTSWSEIIIMPDAAFVLDNQRSTYNLSILEHKTPGVSYYRGDIVGRLIYTVYEVDAGGGIGDPTGETVVVNQMGSFHGFSSAWSASETLRLNVDIERDGWGAISYQIRPNITANKTLQFVYNEPTMISFEGNYHELVQRFAGLQYDIFFAPNFMWDEPRTGNISLQAPIDFEQLPAPDMSRFRGMSAEDDLHRLFAMQIFQGNPNNFNPGQAITRGQFTSALVRAVNIPVEEVVIPRSGRMPVIPSIFSDLAVTHPEYSFIRAAHDTNVLFERSSSDNFYFDFAITREEAFSMVIRALGLVNLSPNPTVMTPFSDTNEISNWAMRYINVAHMLGLAHPNGEGNLSPQRPITVAEAAVLLNHLVSFLRHDLTSEFAEQIVNIVT